ncbi:MAG: nucleotidyl transferase AbiEii/AbiGii toxin family protein [Bacteroidales bacterium]|nr:nucleotidyl transferase AbiEii/AbiGii toxin family protein [Bacteroidales bacterium]
MSKFIREYYLVGGTAISLYIGHRRSIDFDLFKASAINHKRNLDKIATTPFKRTITYSASDQMHLIINGVKLTFLHYPFPVTPSIKFDKYFRMPPLHQLAAMTAYALGRRSKWKDYVDLYFLLHNHMSIADICSAATEIFGDLFSEKLFRSQLCYFDDIDYTEAVDYIVPHPPSNETIKHRLTALSAHGVNPM